VALQSHPNYVLGVFRQLWEELGGTLRGGVRDGEAPAGSVRGRRETQPLDAFDIASPRPAPDREAERSDLRTRLDQALRQLTPEQRQAVLLFDLEGWSHAQVAEMLGTSADMSRQYLMLGRRRLRQLLAEEGTAP